MTPIDLDFTGTESGKPAGEGGDFEPLPDDWYDVKVERAEETAAGPNAANPGAPGVKLGLVVERGPHSGRWIWDRIFFTPKSMNFARQKLEAMGMDVPEGKFSLNAQDLVARRCAVKTQQETYQGKTEAKVAAYDKRSDAGFPASDVDWRDELPTNAVGGGAQDSDIPFACSKV
jgi:hypothetical protein